MVDVLTVSGCGRYAVVEGVRGPERRVLVKDLEKIKE